MYIANYWHLWQAVRMNKYLIDPHLVGFWLFLKWRAEENLVVNNKDNRVFMSRTIGLIVARWKFDVLKFDVLKAS